MAGEWRESLIGDLCLKVTSGGTPRSTVREYYEGGDIPWLNTKEIEFGTIYHTEKSITKLGFESSSAKWIPEKSVIVAMYGATAGKVATNAIPLTTNQACCNLIIETSKADHKYIYFYLSNNTDTLLELANGAAQQNLNAATIKNFPINAPPLPEQKAIAHVLGSLDDKIELNRRMNETLEGIAQALFKSWFVDFDPVIDNALAAGNPIPEPLAQRAETRRQAIANGTANRESAQAFPASFRFTEELGWIPEGWEAIPFKEFTSVKNTRVGDLDVPEYSSTNEGLFPRADRFKKQLSASKSKNKLIEYGDLVFGMSRQVLNFGMMHAEIGSVSSAYHVYRVDSKIVFSEFIESYIRSRPEYYFGILGASSREGQSLSKTNFAITCMLMPSPDSVSKYERLFRQFEESRKNICEESQTLAKLRDVLLPKLISGELRIPQAEKMVEKAVA